MPFTVPDMISALVAAAAATILTLTLAPAPVSAAATAGWPGPGYDAGRSYYNPVENTINASTIGGLKQRWYLTPTESPCFSMIGPVAAGGLTITQDTAGLVARNSTTGQVEWRETEIFSDRQAYNLVVEDSIVIVTSSDSLCMIEGGDADGIVAAFDLATGQLLWRQSPNHDAAQLVVTRGAVIVSGNDYGTLANVEAYRLTNGQPLWSYGNTSDEEHTLYSTMPVGGDVLVAGPHNQVARVDAVTGSSHWGWPSSWTPLTAFGDWLFVGDSSDWSLRAMRVSAEQTVWSMDRVSNRVSTDGRRLYMGVGSSLEAYDVATGKRLWAVNLGARVGQPLRAGGLVYAPVNGKPVQVRNASTGAKVTVPASLTRVSAVAAVGAGRLYAGVGAGRLGVFAR